MEENKRNFLLDVDGVLTNGKFIYNSNGKIMKMFGAHDNDGLKLIKDKLNISFITSDKRGFEISKRRINDMGFHLVYCDEDEKYEYVNQNYNLKTLIYMADGYHDIKILKNCFYSIAPKNALDIVKDVSKYITTREGGDGAVFEACLQLHYKLNLDAFQHL